MANVLTLRESFTHIPMDLFKTKEELEGVGTSWKCTNFLYYTGEFPGPSTQCGVPLYMLNIALLLETLATIDNPFHQIRYAGKWGGGGQYQDGFMFGHLLRLPPLPWYDKDTEKEYSEIENNLDDRHDYELIGIVKDSFPENVEYGYVWPLNTQIMIPDMDRSLKDPDGSYDEELDMSTFIQIAYECGGSVALGYLWMIAYVANSFYWTEQRYEAYLVYHATGRYQRMGFGDYRFPFILVGSPASTAITSIVNAIKSDSGNDYFDSEKDAFEKLGKALRGLSATNISSNGLSEFPSIWHADSPMDKVTKCPNNSKLSLADLRDLYSRICTNRTYTMFFTHYMSDWKSDSEDEGETTRYYKNKEGKDGPKKKWYEPSSSTYPHWYNTEYERTYKDDNSTSKGWRHPAYYEESLRQTFIGIYEYTNENKEYERTEYKHKFDAIYKDYSEFPSILCSTKIDTGTSGEYRACTGFAKPSYDLTFSTVMIALGNLNRAATEGPPKDRTSISIWNPTYDIRDKKFFYVVPATVKISAETGEYTITTSAANAAEAYYSRVETLFSLSTFKGGFQTKPSGDNPLEGKYVIALPYQISCF